jgi:hypothetical protein
MFIDTLEPIENALTLPINSDNPSESFSTVYVKYDISEEYAKIYFDVSIHGSNTWYNSRRQDSYLQHGHLTLMGSQDNWYKVDNVMFAGEGRNPEKREIRGSE